MPSRIDRQLITDLPYWYEPLRHTFIMGVTDDDQGASILGNGR